MADGQTGSGHGGSKGAWTGVVLIILGFVAGAFALILAKLLLAIIGVVLVVAGGVVALASGIMSDVR